MHSLDVIVLRNAEAAGREAREAGAAADLAAIIVATTEAEQEIKDPAIRLRVVRAFNRGWDHGT